MPELGPRSNRTFINPLVSWWLCDRIVFVLNPGKVVAGGLLCLVLAGCSSLPTERTRVSDWSLEPAPTHDQASARPPVHSEPPPTDTQPPLVVEPAPVVSDLPEMVTKPPTPVAPVAVPTWVPLWQWCQAHGLQPPMRTANSTGLLFSVASGPQRLVLSSFSRTARWQGLDVHLGYPTQVSGGELLVHSLDLRKTIQPLLFPVPKQSGTDSKLIVLDPGHGGVDGGAKSSAGLLEKDIALDWARRTAKLLMAQGWEVVLTRTNDMEIALSNRLAIAEACGARLFVSLHFNSAAPNHTQSGLETYCLTPKGIPSALTRGFADDTGAEFPNNAWDDENFLLACSVHGEVSKLPRMRDRGVRRARFLGILRGQQRPAILVEGGYLSNPSEARQLAEAPYRQSLALAVARGITKWLSTPIGELAAAAPPTLPPTQPSLTSEAVKPPAPAKN